MKLRQYRMVAIGVSEFVQHTKRAVGGSEAWREGHL